MTQFDLLNEGFWDKFKSVTKGAVNLGKNVVKGATEVGKFAAEKLTPQAYAYAKGAKDSVKNLNQNVIKATTSTEDYLKKGFEEQGYEKVRVSEVPNSKGKWFKVIMDETDEDGNLVKTHKMTVDKDGYQPPAKRQTVKKNP